VYCDVHARELARLGVDEILDRGDGGVGRNEFAPRRLLLLVSLFITITPNDIMNFH
jgi:hypothetical protein